MIIDELVDDDYFIQQNAKCWFKLLNFIDENKTIVSKNHYYIENRKIIEWLQNNFNTIILVLQSDYLALQITKKLLQGEFRTEKIDYKYQNRIYFQKNHTLKAVRNQMRNKNKELEIA